MNENQKLAEISKLKEKMLNKMNQSKLMGGTSVRMIPGCCGQGCCDAGALQPVVKPVVSNPPSSLG